MEFRKMSLAELREYAKEKGIRNISTLKKFITGVQWVCNTQADRHYEIFCYSYQEEFIRHVAPNPIEIHVVD